MVCPVCIIAALGGLAISRALGVSDMIAGFWLGAVTTASLFWFNKWLIKKYGLCHRAWCKYQTPILLIMTLVIMTLILIYIMPTPTGTCGV